MLVVIAGAILGVSLLSHLKAATPDYREGLVSDERPLSLNPLVGAADPPVRDLGELLYRRLLRLDDRGVPVGDLATGYSVSQDGLTYHVPLRRSQSWSDGRDVAVSDVLATVRWVQSAAFGDPATAAPWRGVHARAEGDGVSFDLAGPRASFAATVSQLPILPLGRATPVAIAALQATAAEAMPTSGAYHVTATSAASITLFPNPHVARQPALNQVQIDLFGTFSDAAAAFRAGTVDGVLATNPVQRAELVAAGGVPHEVTSFRFVDLLFNERNPVLADGAVRGAVATAVNRKALLSGPLRDMGAPQVGAIPAGLAWVAPRPAVPPGDVATASAALEADGWTLGSDGIRVHGATRLQLRLAVADVVPLPDVAVAVKAQLAAIGIDAHLTSVSSSTLRQLLVGGTDFDLAIADWDNGPDPDVSTFWRSTAVPPAGFNVSGGPSDPFLDQALDRLATLSDPTARSTAAQAVTAQLADDLPAVFLETPDNALVVRPGFVVLVPPVGTTGSRFDRIAEWRRG